MTAPWSGPGGAMKLARRLNLTNTVNKTDFTPTADHVPHQGYAVVLNTEEHRQVHSHMSFCHILLVLVVVVVVVVVVVLLLVDEVMTKINVADSSVQKDLPYIWVCLYPRQDSIIGEMMYAISNTC